MNSSDLVRLRSGLEAVALAFHQAARVATEFATLAEAIKAELPDPRIVDDPSEWTGKPIPSLWPEGFIESLKGPT